MSETETQLPVHLNRVTNTEQLVQPNWWVNTVRFVAKGLSRLLFGLRYHNLENIPQTRPGGMLVVANHQSYFDPFWVGIPIKRPLRFMAWDAATRVFIIGNFIRSLGAFPVKLDRGGKEALKISIGWLRAGGTLVVFPEGQRSFSNGEMLEFKTGAVRIAMDVGVPILPVTIRGANRVWAQDMKRPRLSRVEIVYHPLYELPPLEGDARAHVQRITDDLARIISTAL